MPMWIMYKWGTLSLKTTTDCSQMAKALLVSFELQKCECADLLIIFHELNRQRQRVIHQLQEGSHFLMMHRQQ